MAGYRPRNKGSRCGAVVVLCLYQNDCDNAETNPHAGLAFGSALYDK